MGTSQVPTLITNVLAALQASADLAGVQVIDGPVVEDSPATDWVFVGYDGDPGGDFEAANSAQNWVGIGAKRKDEDIAITCAVVASRGDTNVPAARSRAYVLMAAVENALRIDVSLGMPPPTVVEVTAETLYQEQTDSGIQARIPFSVMARTRI